MTVTWTNVQVTLGELKPWADNPRLSSKRQAQRILDSWRKFGQVQTVALGPSNEVYDGHQRLSALLTVHGPSYQIDARRADRELTDEERRALVIALHAGAVGSWNWDNLANWDAGELQEWGFDSDTLANWQRDVGALGNLLASEEVDSADAEPQIDRAAELQEKWQVRPGDLWRIGEHRLACGDCTDRAVVERVMAGEKAETLIFDPEWDAMPSAFTGHVSTLAFCDGATLGAVVERYGSPSWVFAWDCVSCWYTPNRPLRRMKLCAWYGNIKTYNFDGWHYGDAGESREVWNTRGEYRFIPDPRGKHLADVFTAPITKLHSESDHNHSKPLDWVTLLIANCSSGDVADPFLGSGTTLVACQNLGRRGRGIEISPEYCAVVLQRMSDAFPGIEIERIADDGRQ